MIDEAALREQAREKYAAGAVRAALHLWDSLEHPELLSAEEVALREAALRERDSS